MDQAIRNLVEFTECTLEAAATTATTHPAALMRLNDRGSLEAGHRADVVLLDPDAQVVATVVAGQIVFLESPERLTGGPHDPA
jgi:N-acetylglucosamine-6-phosphate deacetylase